VLEELNVALEGIISIAQQAPRIVFMRVFAPYFEGKPSGLNPPSIIRSTEMFQVRMGRRQMAFGNDCAGALIACTPGAHGACKWIASALTTCTPGSSRTRAGREGICYVHARCVRWACTSRTTSARAKWFANGS